MDLTLALALTFSTYIRICTHCFSSGSGCTVGTCTVFRSAPLDPAPARTNWLWICWIWILQTGLKKINFTVYRNPSNGTFWNIVWCVPDPDLWDSYGTYVFGPPGSGFVSQQYDQILSSSSKLVRKNFYSNVLWLLYDFYLWRMMQMYRTRTFKK